MLTIGTLGLAFLTLAAGYCLGRDHYAYLWDQADRPWMIRGLILLILATALALILAA